MKQIPLPMLAQPVPDFASFVPGDNAAALDALQSLVLPTAPVYLWGPAGCGKTHLLRALALQVRQRAGESGWFDAATPLPWTLRPEWTLAVIDDADRLDAPQQHAAFALFVDAATHGVQMAAAGGLPPVDLPVREDLRSRLGWGLVFALQPLSEDATRRVLRREAERCAMPFSEDVLDHLLIHHTRDLAYLMDLLRKLERYSLAEGRVLTVPLLKRMLAEEGSAA